MTAPGRALGGEVAREMRLGRRVVEGRGNYVWVVAQEILKDGAKR